MINTKRSWIYYDPDYSKRPVDLVNHCCRCQKSLNGKTAIPVTINTNTFHLLQGHNAEFDDERKDLIRNAFIGSDCLKTIKNTHKHQERNNVHVNQLP